MHFHYNSNCIHIFVVLISFTFVHCYKQNLALNSKYSYKDFLHKDKSSDSDKGYSVLIVDDFPENLIFVGDYLQQRGINVMFATNGNDALKSIVQNTPDLVLLDISMPNMDGYEICKKLKENPITQHIPVIFLTAKIETDDILKGFESGGVDYITKPFNLLELMTRVNTHLLLKDKHEKLQVMNSKLIDTVKRRTEKLREANDRLAKLDRAKNDFLIHINHQLRTPLNGILGYSELLTKSELLPEQRDFVNEINRLVNRLVKLSERSLLFTELRADTYKLNVKPISIDHTIQKSINTISQRYKEKKIHIINKIGKNPDFKIIADENLFYRCMNIVLDNAVKFAPQNGEVIVETTSSENKQKVLVSDNGPGISDEYKNHLFELFVADNHEEVGNGFGLGLATAKLIMEILSAEIDIISPETGGTRVILTFYNWTPRFDDNTN